MNKNIENILKLADNFQTKLAQSQQSSDIQQYMFLGFAPQKEFLSRAVGSLSQSDGKVMGSGAITKVIADYWNKYNNNLSVKVVAVGDATSNPKIAKFVVSASDKRVEPLILAAINRAYMEIYKKSPMQIAEETVKSDPGLIGLKGSYVLFDGGV